jgi:hypothetical protein
LALLEHGRGAIDSLNSAKEQLSEYILSAAEQADGRCRANGARLVQFACPPDPMRPQITALFWQAEEESATNTVIFPGGNFPSRLRF